MTPEILCSTTEGTASRFLKCQWSKTRQQIHAMRIGDTLRFPSSQYFNAKQSVLRLNDAYFGVALWQIRSRMTECGRTSVVNRVKPMVLV